MYGLKENQIDLSNCPQKDGYYILQEPVDPGIIAIIVSENEFGWAMPVRLHQQFVEEVDYRAGDKLIWSIGLVVEDNAILGFMTGTILASCDTVLYDLKRVKCLWLR